MNTENPIESETVTVNPVPDLPTKVSKKSVSVSSAKKENVIVAVGRRKTAIAKVRLVPSKNGGKITINDQSVDQYFKGNHRHAMMALRSLNAVKTFSGYDFNIKVIGGGLTGQADSICHGIARVLSQYDEKIRVQMRKEGFLTRDPRAVERKKSGQPKARKRFQYSKR